MTSTRPASRPRAILFDWDNTLVDTWPTIVECYDSTFRALGRTPWTAAEVQERAHGSLREVFPTLFGAEDLLAHCDRLGCYVAIVSNKVGDNLRTELAHLGWQRWVQRAVGAKDCARDKPAPDPIFKALDGTGIAPDETVWMVGDSLADLRCAHAAGCLPVLVGGPEALPGSMLDHPPRLRARNCNDLVALL